MKKSIGATFPAAPALLAKTIRLKTHAYVAIVFLAGCAVLDTHQAKLDQKQLREVLMDYTDDQILDNLIRASNGLPIIHFDLSTITASVTSKFTPTVGGGRTAMDVQTHTPTRTGQTTDTNTINTGTNPGTSVVHAVQGTVAVVGGLVQTVTRPFTYNVMAERDNAIGVQVDPVLERASVYAAYIKFLNTDVPGPRKPDVTTMELPEPKEFSPETPVATETADSAETLSTTGEKPGKPKPPRKKPPPEPPQNVDLVLRSFESIKALKKSPTAPPLGEVLVGPKRWKDGMYYWVPTNYRKEFFELCLATVARSAPAGTENQSAVVKELKQSNALERQRSLRSQ